MRQALSLYRSMGFVEIPPYYASPDSRHRLHGAGPVTDRYFEDFKKGERFISGGMTMTEAGIIEFARQWDPQPFHIDAEFAKKWQYGGLIASGLHTMCVTLKLWLELGVLKACSLGSPGLGETQFPRPVRPGDTLRVVTDIVELRASAVQARPRHLPPAPGHDQPARRARDGTGDDGLPEAPPGD